MQAIRTRYKGILFRSKLEAQWAKFFDSIGMVWIYEPEGFVFADGDHYIYWLMIGDKAHSKWEEITTRDWLARATIDIRGGE